MTTAAPKVIVIPANLELVRAKAVQRQLRVAAYCRVSTDDEEQMTSYEAQKTYYTDKIMNNPQWTMGGIFADDGYSGTNFDRPGVQRLIADAQAKRINLILVKDLSRFGRNYIEFGRYIDYVFPAISCRFIALNNGVDTANNDSSMDSMCFLNLFKNTGYLRKVLLYSPIFRQKTVYCFQ